jgi:hypothetical protein
MPPSNLELVDLLSERYGILLRPTDIGDLLGRSPESVRVQVSRGGNPWADHLRKTKRRIGRRTYWSVTDVVTALELVSTDGTNCTYGPTTAAL